MNWETKKFSQIMRVTKGEAITKASEVEGPYPVILGGQEPAFVLIQPIQFFLQHVLKVVDVIGYMPNMQDGITDFVPKNQPAISVAEIIDPNLSYKVIEYNHHSMKGNLERKKTVLLCLADKLEPQRTKLKEINSKLESDLFYLFNNVNLRHNNSNPQGQY